MSRCFGGGRTVSAGAKESRVALHSVRTTVTAAAGECGHGAEMRTHRHGPRCDAERARLRGVLADRQSVGAPAPVPHLRTCRLLRFVSAPARDRALSCHRPSCHRGLRSPEGWGWCYVDEAVVKLDHKTPQRGPIKRWV